jgi:hypothetical protein
LVFFVQRRRQFLPSCRNPTSATLIPLALAKERKRSVSTSQSQTVVIPKRSEGSAFYDRKASSIAKKI